MDNLYIIHFPYTEYKNCQLISQCSEIVFWNKNIHYYIECFTKNKMYENRKKLDIPRYKEVGLNTESTKGQYICTANQTGILILKEVEPIYLYIIY